MKSCKATATTLSPCVLLDPDIQELIYSVLDIKELLAVDLVCKGTRVAKDKYLKAIQSYAFNKVERFINFIADYRVGKGMLADLKPIDLIDGYYDCTQLGSAWKFASHMDYDLEVKTIEIRSRLICCANTREDCHNKNMTLPTDVFALESQCRCEMQKHIQDIFICHFAWCVNNSVLFAWRVKRCTELSTRTELLDNVTDVKELAANMIQMALHSTPELTFKVSALDTGIYREICTGKTHYRLMISTQAHDYMQQRGLSLIQMRLEEINMHLSFSSLAEALYTNTTVIDYNQDPIIYATGLEILQKCLE